jgi:hypothetical protein
VNVNVNVNVALEIECPVVVAEQESYDGLVPQVERVASSCAINPTTKHKDIRQIGSEVAER